MSKIFLNEQELNQKINSFLTRKKSVIAVAKSDEKLEKLNNPRIAVA